MLTRICRYLFFTLLLSFLVMGGHYACGDDDKIESDGQVPDGEVIQEDASSDAPATDAPVPDAPATDAPAADAPATDAPVTEDGFVDAVTSG